MFAFEPSASWSTSPCAACCGGSIAPRLAPHPSQFMDNTPRFLVAAVLCAFAIYWYARRRDEASAPPPDPGVAVIDAGVAPGGPPPSGSPPGAAPAAVDATPRFRRIDPAARAALLARVAARQAGQPAPTTATPAPLPGHVDAKAALDSIMPLLPAFQDCYDETRAASQVVVRYALTLTGDADVGTVISDIELTGDAAFTADPTLATCLRETMLAIELPPMINGATASFQTSMMLVDDPDAPDAGAR
ncbi:MAG: hypothetical protein IPH80_25330 [Myxococcales bacterium]|nr:hypothetical protein [Myxococcales bacterium]